MRIPLSKLEQKIYYAFSKGEVISTQDIYKLKLSTRNTVRKTIVPLIKKNYLLRLKKGLYLILDERGGIEDPMALGEYIFGGYLGLSTALYIYGLIEEQPFTVYVVTENQSRSRTIGNYEFKAVALRDKAVGFTKYRHYTISTRAKTLFDSFYFSGYVGYYNIAKSIYYAKLTAKEWNEFLYYIKKFGSNALSQRIGYVLDTIVITTYLKIPKKIEKELELRVGTPILLNPAGKKAGLHNKKWEVIDNIQTFMGWWYYG